MLCARFKTSISINPTKEPINAIYILLEKTITGSGCSLHAASNVVLSVWIYCMMLFLIAKGIVSSVGKNTVWQPNIKHAQQNYSKDIVKMTKTYTPFGSCSQIPK